MPRTLHSVVIALVLTVLSGCVAYAPVPMAAPQPTPQQRFNSSWAATANAMTDQGVAITAQDRAAGVIRGNRAGVPVTANVKAEADGSVQVSFETVGAAEKDPGLTQRLRDSYLRRMGR